ncbi:MAG: FeoB-associated Cys-rich membrane protein [Ruminococcaceae bacterium]|nr:FeoB-associated Cys-rich membrane protein [Oscillospiraceae bacterium]
MIDLLIILVLLAIAGGIIFYLYKAKKRGETCIGCPYAKECAKKHTANCSSVKKTK